MPVKKNTLILLALLLSCLGSFAQGGFKKNYFLQNSATSKCHEVIEAPDGKLIMIGLTLDPSTAFNHLSVIGTDAQGNMLWRKDYGNSKFIYLQSYADPDLIKDNTGFYFTCPVLDSTNKQYCVLIKFNYAGDTLWQKCYKGQSYDTGIQSVSKSVDGGLILAGFTQNTTFSVGPVLLLKTDINGIELWRKQLISPNSAWPVWSGWGTVQDSTTKQIIVVGQQYIGVDAQSLVMATDSMGTKIWQTTFNNPGGGGFWDVIQTKDKNFITGQSINMNNDLGPFTCFKSLVVKFDINGNLVWSKTYGIVSPYNDVGCFNELPNGDLIMCGEQDTMLNISLTNSPIVKLMVTKTDKDGNLKWRKHVGNNYDYNSGEGPHNMSPTLNGGFVIAAWPPPDAVTPQPYSIVKIDSTGCDTTEAYCQSIATGIQNFTKLTGFEISIFPNPAKDVLHVKADAPVGKIITLKITDATGREIAQMQLEPGKELVLNTMVYESGLYLMSPLYEQKVLETKRLVIVR